MSNTISFNKSSKNKTQTVSVTRHVATPGFVKYSPVAELPTSEEKSVLIFTPDSGEMFIGQGTGVPIKKLSMDNLVFAKTKDGFPTTGQSPAKLYVATDEKAIYVWNGVGYQSISSEAFDPSVITDLQTALVNKADKSALAAKADASALTAKADKTELAAKADRTELVNKADITALNLKADKTDLVNYRKTADKIGSADLATDVQLKIQVANDAAGQISVLQTNKADKAEFESYRRTVDKITEADMDQAVIAKIDASYTYDDTAVKTDILALQNNKADKADLSAKADKTDLAAKADVTALEAKVDASELAAYRKVADKITQDDLDNVLVEKIDGKADATDLGNYRKKADAITGADIDPEIMAKINTGAAGVYDDTQVRTDISNLQTNKADKTDLAAKADVTALVNYSTKTEVGDQIQAVIGAAPDALNTLKEIADALGDDKNFAATMTTNLANKVDAIAGKGLSTNDYTDYEKTKLAGLNNYVHPANHPASMITPDSGHRFVNDTQIAAWDAKANTVVATASADGLLGKDDKAKLDGIQVGATTVASSATNGNIKINGTETLVYAHPENHPATMITEDSTHQFVTAADKTAWSTKQNDLGFTPVDTAKLGVANGVATLGTDGKLTADQLPAGTSTGGGGGSTITTYEAVGSTSGDCIITATGTGVQYSKAGNVATVTPPAGVKILSARIHFAGTEIGTAGGCSVNWDSTLSDTDYVNVNVPLIQVINDLAGSRAMRQGVNVNINTNAHTAGLTNLMTSTPCWVKLMY